MGEACSHVAALLFYLEDFIRKRESNILNGESCTSRLCQWNVPRKRKVEPKPVNEIKFRKALFGKEDTCIHPSDFDPRSPMDRQQDSGDHCKLLKQLREHQSDCVLLHLWDMDTLPVTPRKVPRVEMELDIPSSQSMEDQVKALLLESPLGNPVSCVNLEDLPARCAEYAARQTISGHLQTFIEHHTKGQSNCDLWKKLHIGRLTSSKFGEICHLRPTTSSDRLVSNIMGYSRTVSTAAMYRGLQMEPHARKDYIRYMKSIGHNVSVTECGLTLMSEKSYLGASTDGHVCDSTRSGKGILEIKCPFQIKGERVTLLSPLEIANKFGSDFYCITQHERLSLKRHCNYYYQVQGGMGVTGANWCDFVVWTEAKGVFKNIFVEKIEFDHSFWKTTILPKLELFYTSAVVPEVLTHKLLYNS